MEQFLASEIENFEICEGHPSEEYAEKVNKRVRQWCGTWNNPSMTDEEFNSYLNNLHKQEILTYSVFQREQGEKTGTIHFQFYVEFKNPQYFRKIKAEYLPQGCHFAPMISTPERCQAYCSKPDTRVSGPYELGEISNQGKRTDLAKAIEMVDEEVPFDVIEKIYPTQSLMYSRQLMERRQRIVNRKAEIFKRQERDMEVTYIYGDPGSGKSNCFRSLINGADYFSVDTFDNSAFTGYQNEDILLIDEFSSDKQFTIQFMNKLLDVFPLKLRGLNYVGQACFTKIYLLSNFHYKELYKAEQEENKGQYGGFVRRLNRIIRIDKDHSSHVERETIWEDIPESERRPYGRHKRAKQVIEYDQLGHSKIIFEKGIIQTTLEEVALEGDYETPFED